jgi:hypothetical protein
VRHLLARQAPGAALQFVPAGAPSLYRRRQSRLAEAHASAGGGEPSSLLEVRCQEQPYLQSDMGKAGCEGRWSWALSRLQQRLTIPESRADMNAFWVPHIPRPASIVGSAVLSSV